MTNGILLVGWFVFANFLRHVLSNLVRHDPFKKVHRPPPPGWLCPLHLIVTLCKLKRKVGFNQPSRGRVTQIWLGWGLTSGSSLFAHIHSKGSRDNLAENGYLVLHSTLDFKKNVHLGFAFITIENMGEVLFRRKE